MRQVERMHIVANTVRESSIMVSKAHSHHGTGVIVLTGLNDLRPVSFQHVRGFF
jgi:hypothetical protein